MQCGLKYTGIHIQTRQDNELFLVLEKVITGKISSVLGDRFAKSDETKKILYIDTLILFGWAMSQSLSFDEIKIDKDEEIKVTISFPDISDLASSFEYDFSKPDNMKQKTKSFLFSPNIKLVLKISLLIIRTI